MRKISILTAALIIALTACIFAHPVYASEETYGYIYLVDYVDLLSDAEEEELYNVMAEGAPYGDMVFITIDDSEGYETKDYIERLYQTSPELDGRDAVIYMIDMDNRMLWITGYGSLKKVISPDYGNLITDNVYTYAKDGNYAGAAIRGYEQIVRKLEGESVSGPLRTLGNGCIALILAAVGGFLVVYLTSISRRAADSAILENLDRSLNMTSPNVVKTHTQRIYDPIKSSSGGGGSRGGGGGGGFHGGGGGHGF